VGCHFSFALAHYPHNEAMLRMARSMGVMVWAEVPVHWTIQWENPQLCNNAEISEEMIARDHNRAALIIYSVANETPISDARNSFLRQLVQDAHSADPTRLVSPLFRPTKSSIRGRITIHIMIHRERSTMSSGTMNTSAGMFATGGCGSIDWNLSV